MFSGHIFQKLQKKPMCPEKLKVSNFLMRNIIMVPNHSVKYAPRNGKPFTVTVT